MYMRAFVLRLYVYLYFPVSLSPLKYMANIHE